MIKRFARFLKPADRFSPQLGLWAFNAAFRDFTGQTPTEFRQSMKGDPGTTPLL